MVLSMNDFEFLLFDRIEAIKNAYYKYDLENKSYISFSGGKDSTILHYLFDIALPNNHIPRVFIDTGIEYSSIRSFVFNLASNDKRFVIIKPSINIKSVLETYGYPFKSKIHSHILSIYQTVGLSSSVYKYLHRLYFNSNYWCPYFLKYQFDTNFTIKCSDKCCLKLKKEPVHQWMKDNGRPITITGMRNEEGGNRTNLDCILTNSNGDLIKFHPLVKIDSKFEDDFVNHYDGVFGFHILCELYYPPFSFKRTGCKGCPFNPLLNSELLILKQYFPNEYRQCFNIWKPIYSEYLRLNFRLNNENHSL